MLPRVSETRTERIADQLLAIRGWKTTAPPKGNLLWKNEYRSYPHLLEPLIGRGKQGRGGDGYPDFIVVDANIQPLIIGEAKPKTSEIEQAIHEATNFYAESFEEMGHRVLAAGIAGHESGEIEVRVKKRGIGQKWRLVEYRSNPIQWLPSPDEARTLLADQTLFDLRPSVPSPDVLAKTGDEINRTLRECKISDPLRPAVMGAFMLALWASKGKIREDADHVLKDINEECRKAFVTAGKQEIADSLAVPADNMKLAVKAAQILRILRLLNITTLTAEHDYLGQLYETFFRFTGGNTIGQFFTPRHIVSAMTELCQVTKNDLVVDPACGTGGFLISSLHHMTADTRLTTGQINALVKTHLKGFETEPITAALCVANMILRGDGKTGVYRGDCFTDPNFPEGEATVVLGNPPFPHKKTDDPAEKFVNRGLEALQKRGKLAMIVPGSLLVKADKAKWRRLVLKNNSLEAVITLPAELFQPYASSTTAIIMLERGIPHGPNTRTFFCHIENDGFRLKKNTRVPQPGDQTPQAVAAYLGKASIKGLCTWSRVDRPTSGGEWAPGAYIEEAPHSIEQLEHEADWLVRSLVAFHANHAPEIDRMLRAEDAPTGRPYAELSGRAAKDLSDSGPNTIGSLFQIRYGQKALHSKENLASGLNLILSSSGMDNGCYGFFEFDDLIKPPFVTVPSTGSIGEAFVQLLPCGVTDDCLILTPNPGTDIEDLFIAAAVVRLERWRFNYGRKATPERIAHMHMNRDPGLKGYIKARRASASALVQQTQTVLSVGDVGIGARVRRLAEQWRNETRFASSIVKIAVHPAYQRIIGIGPAAIPYVLEELRAHPGHWFAALDALTQGENPAASSDSFESAREAWLEWGKHKGYL